jgi:hypothetical protein
LENFFKNKLKSFKGISKNWFSDENLKVFLNFFNKNEFLDGSVIKNNIRFNPK